MTELRFSRILQSGGTSLGTTRSHYEAASLLLRLSLPLSLGTAFLTAIWLRFYSGWFAVTDLPEWPAYTAYFAVTSAVWLALEIRYGLVEDFFRSRSLAGSLIVLLKINALTLAIISLLVFFWRGYSFSRVTTGVFWFLHTSVLAFLGLAVDIWIRRAGSKQAIAALLVGEPVDPESVRAQCIPEGAAVRWRRFADIPATLAFLSRAEPEESEVLAVLPSQLAQHAADLAAALERLPVPGAIAVQGLSMLGRPVLTRSYAIFPTDRAATTHFNYIFSKRAFDLAAAAAGALLFFPVAASIALVTLLRSGRPILISQERAGRGERRFRLYKFRTLPVACLKDADHQWTADASDSWGRFLRASGLDELPQLYNVLRGEMSLVGPRPERPQFIAQFRRQLPFYSTRHKLQVGMTGWAQVHGLRGDTSIAARVEHDLYYLRNWSLRLDLRILLMTPLQIVDQLRQLTMGARKPSDARSV